MNSSQFSNPVDIKKVHVTDSFWNREQELVRKEVIPYQWDALNDRVKDADPSFCMRNFKVAGRMMREKQKKGKEYVAPSYSFRGFNALPEDMDHMDDSAFYGFVFQDTDFSKWIEAVGYSLAQHPDAELEKTADEAIDIVCAAQAENGYLDTYYIINGMDRIFTNLKDHHELYCLGHLVEGAVAYYQATGKDKLLKAAMRFADFCAQYFGPGEGQCKGYPGHEIAEMALVRLYEATGDDKYLNLSKFFLDMRGTKPYYFEKEDEERAKFEGRSYKPSKEEEKFHYYQSHKPVREQDEATGHAVRAVYLYSGMADVARLTGDEAMFAACERLWDSITKEKLYVTGGIGGTHDGEAFSFPYDLPSDTAYSETCAAIGLAFFARRMLQISPKSEYADVMESALYNTVLAGMALDGKSFFYVNPLEVVPKACARDSRKWHVKSTRQKWFGCACCPPNIARILSSVSTYAYTEKEDTLFTHLYMGSSMKKMFGDKELLMTMESKLPWEGYAKATIAANHVPGTLAFRIPGWSRTTKFVVETVNGVEEIVVNSQTCSKDAIADGKIKVSCEQGYLYLTGEWSEETISMEFDLQVRLVKANTNVREAIGMVAVVRGPITYCMEEADNGTNLHLIRIDLDAYKNTGATLDITEELGHAITTITLPGKREVESNLMPLYMEETEAEEQSMAIRMVPYYAWNNRGEGEMRVWIRK